MNRTFRVRQRVREAGGKIVRRTICLGHVSKEAAEEFSQQARRAAKSDKPPSALLRGETRQTWTDIMNAYLRKLELEKRGERYWQDTRRYLKRLGEYWGESILIEEIAPTRIREFQGLLRGEGLSEATCDRYLAAGRAAWTHAVDNLTNPFNRVKLYNPRNFVTRYLTGVERKRLLDAAQTISRDLYEIIAVALNTGLRKRNILEMRRDQVDFERGIIQVIQKGGRRHVVSIGTGLADLLKGISDNGTPYFWVAPNGKPYRVDWQGPWKKAKALAGLSPDFRFHDLRHDAGTRAYALTGDLKLAKELLGHSDLKTTERYAHILPDRLTELAEALDPMKRVDE